MLRATSASSSPPPAPYHRPCAPTVTLRSQWDGDTPGFIVDVEIPDWLPDSHVRISMLGIKQVVDCYHANGFTPSTALGSFMVLLGTNPSGASAEGGTLSCKIDGRFNASATAVRYVGSRCFANPPPPPVTFSPCSDASFAWPSSGGSLRLMFGKLLMKSCQHSSANQY
ncbi:hypothetical protein AB1Y20_020019 [Prymnesium parvum]|uniref:Uncharacterized protein n=1 Tax=Prymnesium parvum TaxID=97485 RepID=A0AB34JVX0_PRYPA